MWEVYLEKAGAASKVRFVLSGYYDEFPEYADFARSRCLRAFWSDIRDTARRGRRNRDHDHHRYQHHHHQDCHLNRTSQILPSPVFPG